MKEYFIVFGQGHYWMTKILRDNFSHIHIFCKDEYNWLLLNPSRGYLQVEIANEGISEAVYISYCSAGDSIVRVIVGEQDSRKIHKHMGLFNCVSQAKYILGLRLWCITPYSLYRRLLNFRASDYVRHGIERIELVKAEGL